MLLSWQSQAKQAGRDTSIGIQLRCPRCGTLLGRLPREGVTLICSHCSVNIPGVRGVWKALLPEREAHFARFVEDYQFIRSSEGRGSRSDDYYLALPDRDVSGRNSRQWAIRARTFRYIEHNLLPRVSTLTNSKLNILDLGAGNGWLSYRLAKQGHAPTAIDLMTNDEDGLEAAEHYRKWLPSLFPRFQAEVDNLPFADSQFDLVIFNASFHYSENYEKTIAEAIRCGRPNGSIMIADSPWYSDEESGLRMLEERRALFLKRYGFPSDGLSSREYLTDERLQNLERWFGIEWQVHEPYYGIRWAMRPWVAKLSRRRTPSRFRIYAARIVK